MISEKVSEKCNGIRIRRMNESDPAIFCREERKQGWDASEEKFWKRIKHQEAGEAVALVAEFEGEPAGYINIYWNPKTGAFAGQGIPELVDFAVLEKFRRHGIGAMLMDAAENIAAEKSNRVWLGVGLHSGYGSAQRMYIKRGYIPDGSGVWFRDQVCEPYTDCCNDDDLVLYLIKELSHS